MENSEGPDVELTPEEQKLEQIEAKLKEVAQTQFEAPTDVSRASTLDDLEQRAKAAKATLHKHTAEGNQGNYVGTEGGKSLGKGLQIAYAIIGVPIVAYGVGYFIDRQTGTTFWSGILTILGAAIAVGYAMWSANRG